MAEQVPAELASFLAGIKLPHLGDLLVKHGFDDVDDFHDLHEARGE